jgi:hypothetical protein
LVHLHQLTCVGFSTSKYFLEKKTFLETQSDLSSCYQKYLVGIDLITNTHQSTLSHTTLGVDLLIAYNTFNENLELPGCLINTSILIT